MATSKQLKYWESLKGKHFTNSGQFKKGEHRNPATEFKKGQKPWNTGTKGLIVAWNKGKEFLAVKGENNYQWKGEKASYRGKHYWIERTLGKPDTCEECDKSGLKGHFIHWHNKSGLYIRELTDWIRLCAKCHKIYEKRV